MDVSGLEAQIARVINQSGRKEQEQAFADSQWMIQNKIPLTADNLNYLGELKAMSFPQSTEKLLDQMIMAVAQGKRPQDAVLLETHTLEEQARKAMDVLSWVTDEDLAYVVSKGEPVTIQNLEQAHNQNLAGISEQEKKEIAQLLQSTAEAEKNAEAAAKAEMTQAADVGKGSAGIASSAQDILTAGGIQAVAGADAEQIAADGIQTDAESDSVQEDLKARGSQEAAAAVLLRGKAGQFTSLQIELIAARRQLEEIRMSMTIESDRKSVV